MQLKPFQRLAPYYHAEWTAFARHCIEVMDRAGMLHDPSGRIAIDLACGTGVLASALSTRGFSVVGLDISEEMIRIARAECPTGRFVVGDMREMDLSLAADLVTCTFDSLNYLKSVAEVGKVFRNVRGCLKPEGQWFFDANTPRLLEEKQHGTIHRKIAGYEFEQELFYDAERKVSRTVFRFEDGAYEEHEQRPYTREEIEAELAASGLRLKRCFDDSQDGLPGPGSYRIYYLAGVAG